MFVINVAAEERGKVRRRELSFYLFIYLNFCLFCFIYLFFIFIIYYLYFYFNLFWLFWLFLFIYLLGGGAILL